ncbi:MAG: hypothetical protein AB7U41_04165 [Dongiaceae bacterium]
MRDDKLETSGSTTEFDATMRANPRKGREWFYDPSTGNFVVNDATQILWNILNDPAHGALTSKSLLEYLWLDPRKAPGSELTQTEEISPFRRANLIERDPRTNKTALAMARQNHPENSDIMTLLMIATEQFEIWMEQEGKRLIEKARKSQAVRAKASKPSARKKPAKKPIILTLEQKRSRFRGRGRA